MCILILIPGYARTERSLRGLTIVDFHQQLYIPDIQKLALHLLHVHIIGTFPFFLSDNIKQYAATSDSHRKKLLSC